MKSTRGLEFLWAQSKTISMRVWEIKIGSVFLLGSHKDSRCFMSLVSFPFYFFFFDQLYPELLKALFSTRVAEYPLATHVLYLVIFCITLACIHIMSLIFTADFVHVVH